MARLPTTDNQLKSECFQDLIRVQFLMAKLPGITEGEPSAPHIRFTSGQIEQMEGKAAHEKAYIGFMPITNGAKLTIRTWDKPWNTWPAGAGADHGEFSDAVLEKEQLYMIPAKAVHTEICDTAVDYLVMYITIGNQDAAGNILTGGPQIGMHNLNFNFTGE